MKYLLSFFFCLFSIFASAQSLSYYADFGTPQWKCISIIAPPQNVDAGKIFFLSSTSKAIDEIKEIKQQKGVDVTASLITIGDSPEKYLMVITKDAKLIVLSDQRQITKTLFTLDSKLINPDVKQSASTGDLINNLLLQGIKLLKYVP